ncbi:Fe-S cluster assembly protein SufD [Saccharicrinis fermentans]|uniref:FeS cluster assembly protein SufD n=1 Tax=Saccharicrinis fermentans DSM 9555 = JCM 21142 TaxID=869213 RepID=W7YGS9_9BACT|nr:Fe-S cluster assembly protein SufD [Saccharicrinis fermentans]GAF03591.1 feS cluster assembly protein SufD [Saccharicrinis fermentans DSM 9555 = JCM 21142]
MSMVSTDLKIEQKYTSLFAEQKGKLNLWVSDVISSQREKAIQSFEAMGIPNKRVENYKYTNMRPVFEEDYGYDFEHAIFNQDLSEVFNCNVHDLEATTIYLINGWYYRKNQVPSHLPQGVIIGSLAECSKSHTELFKTHYNQYAKNEEDSLVALNTAFAQDGFFIYIPKGVIIEQPIQIVNIMDGKEDLMAFPRNLVVIEENAQAKILLCEHTITDKKYLLSGVTEAYVAENAVFDMYNIQNQHNLSTNISSLFVSQKAHSSVLTHHLTLHTGITRNNIHIHMDDEHCEAYVYGLFISDKNQHVDNFSFIDHAQPNCYSEELFKGVLDDSATGAFAGKIMVRPDAQKTNAFQRNDNLLLSDTAKMNTKPMLEIYADDVKCSHGATVGQLDNKAMFYLRSRGIGQDEARMLLMYAFAYEAVEKIRVEAVREKIKELVEQVFRGELDKCNSCVLCGQSEAPGYTCM